MSGKVGLADVSLGKVRKRWVAIKSSVVENARA